MLKRLTAFLVLLVVAVFAHTAVAGAVTYPDGFEERTIATGIDQPTDVAWTPDGRMLIAEKSGVLKVVPVGGSVATPILDISERVNAHGDRGLLGIAVDSNYSANRFIYLLYTYEVFTLYTDSHTPAVGRLERFTLSPTNQVANPKTLLGSFTGTSCEDRNGCSPCPPADNTIDCIPSDYTSHTIGTVRSAPDGTLWVGSGDGASFNEVDPKAFRTFDERSMAGKVMHVDRDGRGLPGHPFCPSNQNLDHVCTKIFAKGFRNPFRFTLRPNGGLVVGDVGWATKEELDIIDPNEGGRNWGWPCYEGSIHTSGYDEDPRCAAEYAKEGTASAVAMPDHDYTHDAYPLSNAIVAGPQYTGGRYPSEHDNKVFFGDFARQKMWTATLDSSNRIASVKVFSPDWSGTSLEQAPNGNLVYTAFDWDGQTSIKEIAYAAANRTPIASPTGSPTSGKAPLAVAFNGSTSRDPDGDPITYDWDFGDGTAHSSAVSPSHTYNVVGTYTARLTVRDNRGASASATVAITAGNDVPVATLIEPASGAAFTDGETIALRGSATDPQDGNLPSSAISWNIVQHHLDHVHPVTKLAGASVTFPTPADHDADSYLEITMTATDSGKLTAQKSVNVYPRTTTLTIASSPPGVPITYGDTRHIAPVERTAAIGFRTTLTAPAEFIASDGQRYTFDRWSNGGARALNNITVPATPSTITAHYRAATASGLVGAWGFNEGNGALARDASGYGNDGALSGAAWAASGRYGQALSFDGQNDWVTVADAGPLDLTGQMTLEAWVKPRAATTRWTTILLKESADDTLTYGLYGSGPDGGPSGWARGAGASGAPALPTTRWSHVAFTYDGTASRLYVDGELVRTITGSSSVPPSDRPLRIGGNAMWSDEFYDGLIDEIRVWDIARTPEQVQQDMDSPVLIQATSDRTPPTVSLTAPGAGATVRGTVDVSAAAADDRGVASVQFTVDGRPLGAPDSQAPYSVAWDSTLGGDGRHELGAIARDGAGNQASATARTVTVANDDTTAPTIRVTGPANGTTVGGSVTLAADARDDRGVRSVQFLVDGAALGAPDTSAPFEGTWDTRAFDDGGHSVSAIAVDGAGNRATSDAISVRVHNDGPIRPGDPVEPTDRIPAAGAWGFDELGGTTVRDSSEHGNAGTLSGATRTAGRFGRALSFDGRNDMVTIPDSSSLDLGPAMTLEAWVKPRSLQSGWRTVLLKEGSPYMSYGLYGASSDGTPSGWARNSSAWGTGRVPAFGWTHLAYTYDGRASRLYVNGSLVSTAGVSDGVPASGRPLRIGGNSMWPREFWNGLIDEVRVYDRALDAAQIAQDMATPVNGSVSDDAVPPTVRVTAPVAGATAVGTVVLAADAGDDVGVASVQFRVDGADIGSVDTGAPFRASWDTRMATGGTHLVTAIARDAAGNATAASAIEVSVADAAERQPAGAWSFDERGGPAARDSSGHGNDGRVSGATWVAGGRQGGALSFDGRNDLVTVPDSSSLDLRTGMTLEAWVRPRTVLSGWRTVLLKEDSGPNLAYALYGTSSNGAPSGWARSAAAWSGTPLRGGAWSHLAYTWDGAVSKLYVNGGLISIATGPGPVPATGRPLRIGGDSMWSGESWDGLIDEVRVYDQPLTAAQVAADMAEPVGPARPAAARAERRSRARRGRTARRVRSARSRGAAHPVRVRAKQVPRRTRRR